MDFQKIQFWKSSDKSFSFIFGTVKIEKGVFLLGVLRGRIGLEGDVFLGKGIF